MPLESPNKPADLNRNWPLSTDPVAVGDAHLRAIKKVLKATVLGNFSDRASFMSFYTANVAELNVGCSFFLENREWVIVNKAAYIPSADGYDWFNLDGTYGAIATTRLKVLGKFNSQGTEGLAVINSFQRRRPKLRYVNILTGTEFNTTLADAAFPNGVPIANDVCLQLVPGGSSQNFLRFYNGSSWIPLDLEIYDRAATFGFLAAQVLLSKSVDTDRVRTRVHEVVGDTNMYIIDPDGFGPDELTVWYGSKSGLIGLDGEIFYNALTIANSLRYETVAGQTGGGGEDPDPTPTPPTDATVLTNMGTLGGTYSAESEAYNNSQAYAELRVSLNTNGTFSTVGRDSVDGAPWSGPFLSDTTAGIGAQFEARFEISGTVRATGTFDTWLNITSTRSAGVYAAAIHSGYSGSTIETTARTLTVRVRKIGLPLTEESKVISLSAKASSFPGMIP